jgi:hypothetical protein
VSSEDEVVNYCHFLANDHVSTFGMLWTVSDRQFHSNPFSTVNEVDIRRGPVNGS